MKSPMARYLLCIAGFLTAGCAIPQVRLSIPTSTLPEYKYCIEHSRGVCTGARELSQDHSIQSTAMAWRVDSETHSRELVRAGVPPERAAALASARVDRRKELNGKFDEFATHKVTRAIVDLRASLNTARDSGKSEDASLSLKDVRDFQMLANNLTESNGWAVAREDSKTPTRTVYAAYLEIYTKAYFRNGEFGSLKLTAENFYKRNPELEKYKSDIDPILAKITGQGKFGKIGQTAFVSRSGRQLQFPPLEVTIDPTAHTAVSVAKIDYAEVGADMTRILIEALFDAHDRFPAVSNATGTIKADFRENEQDIVLAEFAAGDDAAPKRGTLTAAQFSQSASFANGAEGVAASATAQAVRGLNIAALNNEALAKVVEALIGTTARKAAEKATYCWYACVVNGSTPRALDGSQRHLFGDIPSDSTSAVRLQLN